VRRRLLLVTLAVTTLLVAAFAIPLGLLVREVARDRAITEAERDMAALAPVLVVDPEPFLLEAAIDRTAAGAAGRLSLWLPDGSWIGDHTPVDKAAIDLARERRIAFSRSAPDGVDVYTPVILAADEVAILRVRVPNELLRDGVATSWAILAVLAAALLIVAVAATDRLARTVTRPATDLATTSRALAGGDARARAQVGGPPEIADAGRALNLLADRIHELLATERERVADLSHRLRTPLTALRLGAEGHGAASLVADVDRLEAEVTELIRAARRPLHEEVVLRCDLAAVVEERAAFWGSLADDDGRRWSCTITPPGPHPVRLSETDAGVVVDVLLGNVFSHTPEGAAYELTVRRADGRVELVVDDGGPGMPTAGAVLGRGASGGGSTGLGLDSAGGWWRAAGGAGPDGRCSGGPRPAGGRGTGVTPVEATVRATIERQGPVGFDEVVRAALYDADGGFYAGGGRAGRRGDFLTSPEVGPLFGVVVAGALDAWWRAMGEPDVFVVVEAAAGPGTLASAVVHAQPACARALRYVLVEPSAPQRASHADRLSLEDPAAAFASVAEPDDDEPSVRAPQGPIVVSLQQLPRLPGPCIVLANELLDNLPFGLAERTVQGWSEVRVGLAGSSLAEVLVPVDAERLPDAAVGSRVPLQPAAAGWLRDALDLAGVGGRVVAIDYASTTAELASRPWTDWVRTYRKHERGGPPLEELGTQDITCEVAIDQLGVAPMSNTSQAEWLRSHGIDELVEEGRSIWAERAAIGDLAAVRARSRITEAEALLDPAGLGAFRVLEWTS
jgi:SAM-dependent MidA family methyltransferase/signal transduction histidine kinase